VNGAGMMLTTEECLLSDVQQRNPGLTREDYESIFAHYLGVDKTIWLHRGIAGRRHAWACGRSSSVRRA
jgi:agmatine deiminase